MNETQVIINLISGEKETLPDAFAALAASTAFTISDIPFAGPISEVRVARINLGQVQPAAENCFHVALCTRFLADVVHVTFDTRVAIKVEVNILLRLPARNSELLGKAKS